MTCTQSDTLIQRGIDGRLTPAEQTRLDTHLDHCPACRVAWDGYRRLTQTATDWARHPSLTDDPNGAFTAQVLAQIAARPAPVLSFPAPRLVLAIFLLALTALSLWAGPQLLPYLPTVSFPRLMPAWDLTSVTTSLQTLSHLPQDALTAWAALTARPIAAPGWLWSVLAVTFALNVAFVWRARHSAQTETAR